MLSVLELWTGKSIALQNIGGGEIVQNHVHTCETRRGHVHLLTFQGDMRLGLSSDF